MNTSIRYHGDHPEWPYRVVDNGVWIASVPHYLAGDTVLTEHALMRIYVNVMERIAHPRRCIDCGDLTASDRCAACEEDRMIVLLPDVDFAPVGWAE